MNHRCVAVLGVVGVLSLGCYDVGDAKDDDGGAGASGAGNGGAGGAAGSGGSGGTSGKGGSSGSSGSGGSAGSAGSAAAGGTAGVEPPNVEWTRVIPTDDGSDENFHYHHVVDLFATRQDTLLGRASLQYRSTDRGLTWTRVAIDLGEAIPTGNVWLKVWTELDSGQLFATTDQASDTVLRSVDDGVTWAPCFVDTDPDVKSIVAVSVTEPDKVAVLSDRYNTPDAVFVSRDGGDSFDEVPWGRWLDGGKAAVFDRYSTLHVLSSGSLYRTRDGGHFWYSAGELGATSIHGLRDGTLLGVTDFFTSGDYGDTWTSGVNRYVNIVLLGADEHLFMLSSDLQRSVDRGQSFHALSLPDPADVGDDASWTTLAQLSDGTLVLNGNDVTSEFDVPYLFVSGPLPAAPSGELTPATERPSSCYDGALSDGEERADCGGICGICEDWAQVYNETRSVQGLTASGTLIAHDGNDNLRSTDSGRSWALVTPTYPKFRLVDDHAGTVYAVDDSNNLHVSADDGVSFTPVVGGTLPGTWLRAETSARLWSNTRGNENVYNVSDDGGLTWTSINNYTDAPVPVSFDSARVPFTVDEYGVNRLNEEGTMFDGAVVWPEPLPASGNGSVLSVQVGTTLLFWVANGFGATQTLYRSEEPFDSVSAVAPLPYELFSFLRDSSGRLLIATERGVYVSKDAGLTWEPRNNGLTLFNPMLLGITPSDEAIVVESSDLYVSRPTTTW